MSDKPFHRVADHGVIGDMRTLALVALDGTIDFLCYPDIDSPTLFAGLLDREKGGVFRLGVGDGQMLHRQIYLPDTNILITRFLGEGGTGEVCDFMPLDGSGRIVRRAKAIMGDITFSLAVSPRPDYARAEPRLERTQDGFSIDWPGADKVYIHTSMPVEIDGQDARGELRLCEGETCFVVLCPGRPDQPTADDGYVRSSFSRTRDYWHKWVGEGKFPSYWRDLVVRSALTLKLLTSQKHGSIAAAATFGLPEVIGGGRNWDYRFCWVRDAAFTVYGLSRLGYYGEASAFIRFLMERVTEDESGLQIMYCMDGSEELAEISLDHLAGYEDSRPVRIGNGAYKQRQMDIFGEFMDALYISVKERGKPSHALWKKIMRLMDWLCDNWRLPDNGIWESRGEPREYLSSRLMCWVAIDRGVRMANKQSLPGDLIRWREVRDTIQRSILEEFWSEELGAFVQFKGATTLDAVVLLMPLVKFINPLDPMWVSTLAAVRKYLVRDCLVRRYINADANYDGLDGEEGAFTIGSFWYVEALARTGHVAEARFLFEKLHAYANHLGLYSEELSSTGDHLGNFPQGLTHLSLISAAFWLDEALTGKRGKMSSTMQLFSMEDPDGGF